MATVTRDIEVGGYYVTAPPWNGTWIYGFSHGTYKYGDLNNIVYLLDDSTVVTLNTVRWTSSDPSFNTGQGSIYFRLDGLSNDTGWTSFTINGYTYNRADCTAFPGNNAINWKVAAPVNPFGTSGTVSFSINGITSNDYGLVILNEEGYPRLTFNENTPLIYGYIEIANNSITWYDIPAMTTNGEWSLCIITHPLIVSSYAERPTATVSTGGFSINWGTSTGDLNVFVVRS